VLGLAQAAKRRALWLSFQPPRTLCRVRRSASTGQNPRQQVWVAGDVGSQIINPSGALNEVQGSVIEGLSHLWAMNHHRSRPPVQSNFTNTRRGFDGSRRKSKSTSSRRTIADGTWRARLPPVCPAVCNALFTLTGKRIRTLPLAKQATPGPKRSYREARLEVPLVRTSN